MYHLLYPEKVHAKPLPGAFFLSSANNYLREKEHRPWSARCQMSGTCGVHSRACQSQPLNGIEQLEQVYACAPCCHASGAGVPSTHVQVHDTTELVGEAGNAAKVER